MQTLSLLEARQISLAAQGFGKPKPRKVNLPSLKRMIDRISLLQIDSVNVLVRAHYFPLYARLGSYDVAQLDKLAYKDKHLYEYWAHAACLIPMSLEPYLRFRAVDTAAGGWGTWEKNNRKFVREVYRQVERNGPLTASQLNNPGQKFGPWWGWRPGKLALECLFSLGKLTVSHRTNFERFYDIPGRVFPPEVINAPTPNDLESHGKLIEIASRSLGVGTARDIFDYFRLNYRKSKPVLDEMASSGLLTKVAVEGWNEPAYLHPQSSKAIPIKVRAFVTPFDSLVWERKRLARLFNFDYTIEIYTPAPKRKFGYYVMPFLLDEAIVGRVDLKFDRQKSILMAKASHIEIGQDKDRVADAMAESLTELSMWLGAERITGMATGNLGKQVKAALTT